MNNIEMQETESVYMEEHVVILLFLASKWFYKKH